MSDPQTFIVTHDGSASIFTPGYLQDQLGPPFTVTEVTDTPEQSTDLPWRVTRDGRTVAAVEDPTKALAVLQELADDLTLWRLEFHMARI